MIPLFWPFLMGLALAYLFSKLLHPWCTAFTSAAARHCRHRHTLLRRRRLFVLDIVALLAGQIMEPHTGSLVLPRQPDADCQGLGTVCKPAQHAGPCAGAFRYRPVRADFVLCRRPGIQNVVRVDFLRDVPLSNSHVPHRVCLHAGLIVLHRVDYQNVTCFLVRQSRKIPQPGV